ncbi:MAG: magnesium-translocating P-type ATPase [Brevinematales bacterium]
MGENRKVRPGKSIDDSKKLLEMCSLSEDQALEKMSSRAMGLTAEEAGDRIKDSGRNILQNEKRTNLFIDFILRFKDPLVIQLLVICIALGYTSDPGDPSAYIVAGMVLISVLIGFIQESRSGRAVAALKNLIQTNVLVLRNGKEEDIPIADIVPGDIVVLNAGSIIPADVRVISAKDFFLSQSVLTGESMPVEKFSAPQASVVKEAIELSNACFQGSNVVSGSARAVVINTGARTMLGAVSGTLSGEKGITGFDKGVRSFVWLMIRFMIVMVSVVFLIVGISKQDWQFAFIYALTVAVGLTPEMLPMIVTVCLSKGAIAMSHKKVIIKKLKAIQNFGAMNILCTDKTGTLTQDNIILEKYVDITNRKSDDVLLYAYLNSYYQTGLRNLMDRAILSHEDLSIDKSARKLDEIPFDFVRKRMSVVIEWEDAPVLICKGAVEDVYNVCSSYQVDDDIYPLIDMIRNDLFDEYRQLSLDGYRLLAIAYKEFSKGHEVFSAKYEKDMILLGYVAFFDPPKDSAAKALEALDASGVEVKILTGDNELVTQKVCSDVGLKIKMIVTGHELSSMDDAAFKDTLTKANVFARLSPAQKEKIIKVLRSMNNVVGFMGDGINDAPAMKAADVGISVDTAVDIAKESADIILLEKSLMVLEEGIKEGRKVFANIIKYIKMGASSNFGNMFSVVGSNLYLPFVPMAPIQVLINNFMYDISQTGIPLDNVDDEFIKKPQKWEISFISRFMLFIGPTSSIFDYATFFLMNYAFNCIFFTILPYGQLYHSGAIIDMNNYYQRLFHTGWFVESIITQTLVVYFLRTNKIPFFQSRPSFALTVTTLSVVAVGIYLPFSPFASLFGLVPLPPLFWPWIAGFMLLYSIIVQFVKTWFNKTFGAKI